MCRFIFFQFSQHQFLKRPISAPLSNISWLYFCDSIFATFILFCWYFLSLIPFRLSYLNFSECLEVVLFEFLNFPWYSHAYFRILPLLSNSESVCQYPQKSCAENFLLCLSWIHKFQKEDILSTLHLPNHRHGKFTYLDILLSLS